MLEKKYEICSKLTIKTPAKIKLTRFSVFFVNFERFYQNIQDVQVFNYKIKKVFI